MSDERALEILQEVGLDEFLQTLPDGLNTKLGEHGVRLSGGQKQRISIARALIRQPKIIIFDEATSALDTAAEKQVQAATEKLMGTCTSFVVAHRLSTIKNADKIIFLKDGKIAEEGTYEELIKAKGYFHKMQK